MKQIKTEYIPLSEENKYLRVSLYYDLGGMNYFTYEVDKRGYYVSVRIVERANGWESYTMFDGYKQLVVECKRQSKRHENDAVALMEPIKQRLVARILAEKGLELGDVA